MILFLFSAKVKSTDRNWQACFCFNILARQKVVKSLIEVSVVGKSHIHVICRFYSQVRPESF